MTVMLLLSSHSANMVILIFRGGDVLTYIDILIETGTRHVWTFRYIDRFTTSRQNSCMLSARYRHAMCTLHDAMCTLHDAMCTLHALNMQEVCT